MKKLLILLLSAFMTAASAETTFKNIPLPGSGPQGFVWPSEIPEDCPFEQSELFNRVYFTGRHSDYRCGDTFYPSWASDDRMYSPWTDGGTDGVSCRSYPAEKAHTGQAVMIGDDPLDLIIKNTAPPVSGSAVPYRGRYPAGSLVHDGIWYYGTYCLNPSASIRHNEFAYNWPVLGAMPGFRLSFDLGKTWHDSPHTPDDPLFPEPKKMNGAVKMGAPHFVDFGKNMENSPDGKAYLIAMGAEDDDPEPRPCVKPGSNGEIYELGECPDNSFSHANLSWISSDQIYLARVIPSPKTINDEAAYEYFGGYDWKGDPVWTDDFERIKPLLEWNNNMGCVTATYVPQFKKYLMCVTDGWPTCAKMNSYILEADELTGPWRIITYMKDFGEQAYFLNFPTKFISEDGKKMWLCYSANFWGTSHGVKLKFNPPGGRYGLCLHEMRFLSPDEKDPVAPKAKADNVDIFEGNLAPAATVTVSSTHPSHNVLALTDGEVKGYPEKPAAEWASNGEKAGAWVSLEWDKKQTVGRILLFDRPNNFDHILAGVLTFSDESTIQIKRELPDAAKEGLEISFDPKNISSLKFEVTKTSGKTLNIGLSELAVFK